MQQVRVRFAPSPTGRLHIGGARSALFNYLYAAKSGGCFILRSEDTDLARSRVEYEEGIAEALGWLGMRWQEGVNVGGAFAPYRQSQRLDVYQAYLEQLKERGYVYECFCSEEELEAERQELRSRGESPRYLGRCARLTEEEQQARRAQGIQPALRFRVRPGLPLVVADEVRGRVVFEREGIGDFIIAKSDGVPTYNFAVVVDDLEMEVTHVIRGEEHLSNTPCQLLILEALGKTPPQYAHISLILNEAGKKMTKRDGDISVEYYREQGYLPEALVNFVALLGWSPVGDQEILSADELVEQFSLERVSKAPAVFDRHKLDYFNAHYIKMCDQERLAELILPFVQQRGLWTGRCWQTLMPEEQGWLALFAEMVKEKINTLRDAGDFLELVCGPCAGEWDGMREAHLTSDAHFTSEAREILGAPTAGAVREAFKKRIIEIGENPEQRLDPPQFKSVFKQIGKELGLKGKDIFMPLRVSVTGQVHGPDLDKIFALLGLDNILARMELTETYTAR